MSQIFGIFRNRNISKITVYFFFSLLLLLCIVPDGYGAGYTCSASAKKYTSCKSGYYLNGTGAGNSCSTCSSLGYTSSANGNSNGAAACYKSCTKACTRQTCPSSAYSCSHGSTSTSGTQYYGGSCSAPSSTCSLTINSCKSGYYKNGNSCATCSSLGYTSSANGNSNGAAACYKSCTRACTRQTCPSNATCTHGSSSTSGTQYYGGSCSAASSTCSISISCNSGYYKSGSSCPACTSVSATDLSQSCSRNPTSTELSNAHAYAGTISGAKQQCTGKHTGGAGGTAGSGSCTGCSSWGSCSGGTLTITSCSAGYYKDGNSCKSCPSGYTSANGTTGGIGSCYKFCTKSCTQSCTISNASSCTYGSKTTSGTQYYGGSCDAANPGNCPITGWSCNAKYYYTSSGCSACTGVSATDLSQSCSRNPTSTELSNAHAYAGTISGAKQQCTGKHTGGAGGTAGSGSCTGCSSWGSCSGGTLTITSCSAGYYLNGYGAGNRCLACTSISATDLSQSCSRNPTSTELSNAHATAGTISGAKQQCTGKHTSGPVGATSGSQCTGCSSWGSCSGGTVVASACQAGYYKNGNSCEKCPTGYTSANGTTGGIGSCYINVSAGNYIKTANSSTQSTCTAGYWNPAHTVYYGNTSSCNKCTGTTYSDTDGASSCKQCPTATEYADIITSYWYWSEDDIHDTIGGCRAEFDESDSKGSYNYSCAYKNGDYGVAGGGTGTCMATKPNSCAATYYWPGGDSNIWAGNRAELLTQMCSSVGKGYWSAAGSLTRNQCPANYRDGAAAGSQNNCIGIFEKTGARIIRPNRRVVQRWNTHHRVHRQRVNIKRTMRVLLLKIVHRGIVPRR